MDGSRSCQWAFFQLNHPQRIHIPTNRLRTREHFLGYSPEHQMFQCFDSWQCMQPYGSTWLVTISRVWAAAAEFQADSPCTGWRGGVSWRLDVGDFERMVESYGPIQANFKGNSQVIHTYMRYIHIYTYDIYIYTYLHDTRFIRTQYTHTINKYIYILYYIYVLYTLYIYVYIYIYYTYVIHIYIWIMHENVWSCLSSSGTDAVFLSPI